MLRKIKINILLLGCRLNVFYPQVLGFGYWYYKNVHIKNNFKTYNSTDKVLEVVNEAIKKVPYYKNKYSTAIQSINHFEDTVDFTDKAEVMAHWDDFILPKTKASSVVKGTTGGTSGKPLKLVIPKKRYVLNCVLCIRCGKM